MEPRKKAGIHLADPSEEFDVFVSRSLGTIRLGMGEKSAVEEAFSMIGRDEPGEDGDGHRTYEFHMPIHTANGLKHVHMAVNVDVEVS